MTPYRRRFVLLAALFFCASMTFCSYFIHYDDYSRLIANHYSESAHLLLKESRVEEAMELFQKAIERSDHRAYPHFALGQMLWLRGEKALAVGEFRRALIIYPAHSRAHHELGLALAVLGRVSEAAAHCRKAHELDPDLFTRPDCSAP